MRQTPDLGLMAEALCEAVELHADLYEDVNPAPQPVIAAEVRIAELASRYSNLVKQLTGTDVMFGCPAVNGLRSVAEAEVVDPEQGDASGRESSRESDNDVYLVDQYVLRVQDEAKFAEFVQARLGYMPSTPEEMVHLMCKLDGWKPENYPKGMINIVRREIYLCLGLCLSPPLAFRV
jgi:hypothetical protein